MTKLVNAGDVQGLPAQKKEKKCILKAKNNPDWSVYTKGTDGYTQQSLRESTQYQYYFFGRVDKYNGCRAREDMTYLEKKRGARTFDTSQLKAGDIIKAVSYDKTNKGEIVVGYYIVVSNRKEFIILEDNHDDNYYNTYCKAKKASEKYKEERRSKLKEVFS